MPITSTGAWTKNYEAMKRYWAARISPASNQPFGSIVDESGVPLYKISYVSSYNASALPLGAIYDGSYQRDSSEGQNLQLVLGGQQSSVTPSEDDYTIYGPIRNSSKNSILSYRNITNAFVTPGADGEGNYVSGIRSSVTIQNITANPITVYEWGLFTGLTASVTSGGVLNTRQVLIYRGVLSEPVTLGQWDTITITFDRYMKVALQESGTTP